MSLSWKPEPRMGTTVQVVRRGKLPACNQPNSLLSIYLLPDHLLHPMLGLAHSGLMMTNDGVTMTGPRVPRPTQAPQRTRDVRRRWSRWVTQAC